MEPESWWWQSPGNAVVVVPRTHYQPAQSSVCLCLPTSQRGSEGPGEHRSLAGCCLRVLNSSSRAWEQPQAGAFKPQSQKSPADISVLCNPLYIWPSAVLNNCRVETVGMGSKAPSACVCLDDKGSYTSSEKYSIIIYCAEKGIQFVSHF